MALRVLRKEFRLKNFGYNHPNPSAFWRSQWNLWDIEHLTLRSILALYAIYAWIHAVCNYYMVAVNHDDLRNNTMNATDLITIISSSSLTNSNIIGSSAFSNISSGSNFDKISNIIGSSINISDSSALSNISNCTTITKVISNTTNSSISSIINSTQDSDWEMSTPLPTATEYNTGVTVMDRNAWDTRRPWYVFLTMWSYTVLTLHLVLAALLAVVFTFRDSKIKKTYELQATSGIENVSYCDTENHAKAKQETPETHPNQDLKVDSDYSSSSTNTNEDEEDKEDDAHLPWYFKLSWLLSDIITPVAPIVSMVFFGALYSGRDLDVININLHAMNTVLVLLDQALCARPVRLLHVLAPIVYGFVYNVFNYVYWTYDHVEHLIYPGVIDWSNLGRTVFIIAIIAFVVAPLMTFFWFLFYRLKLKIYSWLCRNHK